MNVCVCVCVRATIRACCPARYIYVLLLGPFYGAIAVPSVTRCRCRCCRRRRRRRRCRYRCAGGVRQ